MSSQSIDVAERQRTVPAAPAARGGVPIRGRVVLVLLLLIPAMNFLQAWGCWLSGGSGAISSLVAHAVAMLGLLALLNLWLKRRHPRWAFYPGELMAIYFVLATAICLSGNVWGWGGSLAASITYPIWQAGPGNRWAEIMWPYLPPDLMVTNRAALQGFYYGSSSAYRYDVLAAWIGPALWWTAWITATLWVTLCLSVIVHRRWSVEEKLPFPMTILPVHLAEPEERLFPSSLWWIGLLVSAGLGVLGVIHRFVPAVPTFPTYIDISNFLNNNKPWDAIRTTSLSWDPWSIGLSYLMPLDLTFSLIVFNLFWRAEYVGSRVGGWLTSAWGGFPYGDQQVIGGYLALMGSVVWLDRRYLLQVVRKALGLSSPLDDRDAAFSYRTAVLGLLAGVGFLLWFYGREGMGLRTAAPFMLLYFTMVMMMVRMRAQLGPPAHWMYGTMPEFVFTVFPGTQSLDPHALGMIAMLRPFQYEQDANPAPIQIEGLRLAERGSMDARRYALLMILVVPLIGLTYFWANLHIGYRYGLGAKVYQDMISVCRQGSDKLDDWLRTPGGPNYAGTASIGIGFVATLLLMAAKLRFPMWPLHPLAFPLAFSWSIDSMIPAITITWCVKALLLRYGGLRAYRRALPFFLGLIVGDATVSLVQTIVYHCLGIA